MLLSLAAVCVPVCACVYVCVCAGFFMQIDYGRVQRCATWFNKMICRAQAPACKMPGRGQRWVEIWKVCAFTQGCTLLRVLMQLWFHCLSPHPNFSKREWRKLSLGSVPAQYWGERTRFGISGLALKVLSCFYSWVTLGKLQNLSELALTYSCNMPNTDSKACTWYDFLYMTFQRRQNYRDRETVVFKRQGCCCCCC